MSRLTEEEMDRLYLDGLRAENARLLGIDCLLHAALPIDVWHEDDGDVLWWKFPITESPYVGSPLDTGFNIEVVVDGEAFIKSVGGWPGYHTHWTPLPDFEKIIEVNRAAISQQGGEQ